MTNYLSLLVTKKGRISFFKNDHIANHLYHVHLVTLVKLTRYARKFKKGNLACRDINNTKLNPPFFPKIVDCCEVISYRY